MPMSRQTAAGAWETISTEQHAAEIVAELAAGGINVCPTCMSCFPLPPDGKCRDCEYRAALPEVLRSTEGAAWSLDWARREDREVIAANWRRYDALAAQVDKDAKTPPNGCAQCGLAERGHGQRYGIGGWHTWDAPTDRLRKERMLARRAVADDRPWIETNRRFAATNPHH